MGAFDDLIPAGQSSTGAFDDLIPVASRGGGVLEKPTRALAEYVKGMIPTTREGWQRAANIPTDWTDPRQLAEFAVPPLRPMYQIPEQIQHRYEQIQQAEQTPAWSQERWNAGLGTALDVAGLGAMLRGGLGGSGGAEIATRSRAGPPVAMPGERGFTTGPIGPPVPLPQEPIAPSWQPIAPGAEVPYGPTREAWEQARYGGPQTPDLGMWPLSTAAQQAPPGSLGQLADLIRQQPPEPPLPERIAQVETPPAPVAPVEEPPAPAPAPTPEVAPTPAPVQEPVASVAPKVKRPRQFKQRPPFDAFGSEQTPVSQFIINSIGKLKSKSTAIADGTFERSGDQWDGAPTLSHATHNKIYASGKVAILDKQGKPTGKFRSVGEGGIMPDVAAEMLHREGLLPDGYADSMWQAIEAESRSVRSMAKQERSAAAIIKELSSKGKAYEKAQVAEQKGGAPAISARDLQVGDTVKVEGQDFKVTDIDPETFDVTLEDGTKFGIQRVADNEVIYGEHTSAPSELKLAPPESDAEMLERQQAEQKANAELQLEAEKKAQVQHGWKQKLTGTAGDLGQQELGGELGGNEGLFGRRGIERSGEAGGVPLPGPSRVLPPGAVKGSGRYKPVYQVDKVAGDKTNALAASRESADLRATIQSRKVLGDLTPPEQQALGQYLVSERLKTVNPDHPQILNPMETARIARNPQIARALNRYVREVKPEIEALRKQAGLTAEAAAGKGREFISLIPAGDEMLPEIQTPMGGVPLKFRAKTTRFAKQAEGLAAKYETDLPTILRESYGEVTQKARLRDLYDYLAKKGLARTEAVDEINGQRAQPLAIGRAAGGEQSTALPEVAYMPHQIVGAIRDIMEQPPEIPDLRSRAIAAAQKGVTGTALTGNPPEIVNHMRRQLDLAAATPPGHVHPGVRALEAVTPYFGPRLGTAIRGITADASSPEFQGILQDIFDAHGGSARAFQEYQAKSALARKTGLPVLQKYTRDLMFGIPEGRGVKGWDLRMRVEMEKARRAIEGNVDPQRIREFSNQLGQYTSKPDKFIEQARTVHPYAASSLPMLGTEFRQAVGGSGLKAKTLAGAAGLRAETLLRGVGGTISALVVANHLLSGHWPWQNEPGHETDLETPMRDANGKPIYAKLRAIAPTLSRVVNALSIPNLLRERTAQKPSYVAAGAVGPANLIAGQISSPLSNAVATALTGRVPYLTKKPGERSELYDVAGTKGEGWTADRGVRQLLAALQDINPIGRAATPRETDLPSPLKYIERPAPGLEPLGRIFTSSYEPKPPAPPTTVAQAIRAQQKAAGIVAPPRTVKQQIQRLRKQGP